MIKFITLIAVATLICSLPACKKSADYHTYDSKISFSFNGNRYVLPQKEGGSEWGIMNNGAGGIFINRSDIFKGIIYYPHSNCAFFEPDGSSVQIMWDCQLSSNSFPLDSTAVYLYSEGSINLIYKNCQNKTELDPFTGRTIRYDICDVDGTFDLVLKNKENKTIRITDGKLEVYNIRR